MPALSGRIQKAPSGAKGFDTDVPLSLALAKKFKNDGYVFCVRYLSRLSTDDEVANGDLTRSEADNILKAGLGLMAVQHVGRKGWIPSPSRGTILGNHAANNAIFSGLPAGINIWLDFEDAFTGFQDAGLSESDVINFCNNWFEQVKSVGYIPGIYVGFDAILDSDQLFHSLNFQHYWRAPGDIPDIAVRGYQVTQPRETIDIEVHGIVIDIDIAKNDRLGGQALWLIR
jgi:Domain of unknown function (DUF1906)